MIQFLQVKSHQRIWKIGIRLNIKFIEMEIYSKSYTEQITQLKESPLFALSLCSKELAHSNMWKWLMDTDREFAKAFFDNIDINNIKYD